MHLILSFPHLPTSEPGLSTMVLSFPLSYNLLFTLILISKLHNASRIQWNSSDSVCTWIDVTCDSTNSSVTYLRLPAAGLVGTIPPNTIGKVSQLRVLSLRSNALTGEIPSDFSNLILLRGIYLQHNRLSGDFPASVIELTRLTRVDLSGNKFTGSVPFSVNNLIQLSILLLHNNEFSGEIPSINQESLVSIDISNNKLNGSIPRSLSRFPASAFAGNINLCGKPLPPCTNTFFSPPSPTPSSLQPPPLKNSSKKLSKGSIIIYLIIYDLIHIQGLIVIYAYLIIYDLIHIQEHIIVML